MSFRLQTSGAIMSRRAPDLTGAWVKAVERSARTLTLSVEGRRRFGLMYGGAVVFDDLVGVKGSDPRLPSTEPALTAGMTVGSQRSGRGTTALVLVRHTGPGEVDERHFTISHRRVRWRLRVRPLQTMRAWVGLHPLPRDLRYSK